MLGLRPRSPLTLTRKAWAVAQHVLMPNDWPTTLLDGLGAARALNTVESVVESARRLGTADSLRIAFAADFHAGPTTHPGQIDRAVAAILQTAPGLILLGGDFVGHRPSDMRRLAPALHALKAPFGTFAVLGNHDNNTDPALVASVLADCGIRLLVNEAVRLPPPYERTQVIGLDDHMSGSPDSTHLATDPDATTILLVHQPSGVLDAGAHRIDLALAGHTHGGQIVLPGGFAPLTPGGSLSRRYLAGRYALPSGGTLLVSRGVGASTLPIRWNAPADFLSVTLMHNEKHVSS